MYISLILTTYVESLELQILVKNFWNLIIRYLNNINEEVTDRFTTKKSTKKNTF